ncbi:MAG: PEP-CTERM sorting domain-containing protein [Pseudomonadota bacterium]
MGFANAAGVEGQVGIREILGNKRGYNSTSGTLYDTGLATLTGELSAQHYAYEWEENPDWYWFVVLEAHLSEAGVRSTSPGDPAPANMNGDFLRVVVPSNSIDVGVNAVPVPEAQSWAMALAGLGVAGLVASRRRRAQR